MTAFAAVTRFWASVVYSADPMCCAPSWKGSSTIYPGKAANTPGATVAGALCRSAQQSCLEIVFSMFRRVHVEVLAPNCVASFEDARLVVSFLWDEVNFGTTLESSSANAQASGRCIRSDVVGLRGSSWVWKESARTNASGPTFEQAEMFSTGRLHGLLGLDVSAMPSATAIAQLG